MSFYGSVYYQLIDTFYKIVVKNGGDKTYNFIGDPNVKDETINPSGTAEEKLIESPAIGRKGVFSLDSGNYWINFSRVNDINEVAPYKIWHSKPHNDPETRKRVSSWDIETDLYESIKDDYGFEKEVRDKKTDKVLEKNVDYIQLEEHEFLRMYPTHYDEAGHIIGDTSQSILYRLPRVNISERLSTLEGLVGDVTIDLPRPDLTAEEISQMSEEELAAYEGAYINDLSNYAEQNFEDIKLLEHYLGDWSLSHDSYGSDKLWQTSLTEWIGDLDSIYSSADGGYNFLQNLLDGQKYDETTGTTTYHPTTLADILGSAKKMWDEYAPDGKEKISYSEALCKARTRLNDHDTSIGEVSTRALANANDITILEQTVGLDLREGRVVFDEINKLNQEDSDIRNDFAEADINNFNTLTTNYTNKDNEIIADLNAAKAEYQKMNSDMTTRVDGVETAYKAADTALGGRIDATNADIAGFKSANTAEHDGLGQRIANLDTIVGTRGEQQGTVYGEINSLHSLAEGLRTDLGTPQDTKSASTAFGKIASNASEIENIKLTVGTIPGGNVGTELTNLNAVTTSLTNDVGARDGVTGTIFGNLKVLLSSDEGFRADINGLKADVSGLKTLTNIIGTGFSTEEGQSVTSQFNKISNKIEDIEDRVEQAETNLTNLQSAIGEIQSLLKTLHPESNINFTFDLIPKDETPEGEEEV